MLLEHLEKVRRMPYDRRRRYAFTVSVSITGLIVLIWLSVVVGGTVQIYPQMEQSVDVSAEEEGINGSLEATRDQFNTANQFLQGAGGQSSRAQVQAKDAAKFTVPTSMADGFDTETVMEPTETPAPIATSTQVSSSTSADSVEEVESLVPQPSVRP